MRPAPQPWLNPLLVVVAYLVCAVVWGTTWFAIRVSIGDGGYPTFPAAALRFTVAALVLGAIWLVGLARPGPTTRRQLGWLIAAGILNTLSYSFVYRAEESLPGALAAVLFGTLPLFTALVATVTRTERVTAVQVAGALVALFGVALIFNDRLSVSADQALGIGLLLGAAFTSSVIGVILKRETTALNPLAATGVFLTVTAVMLWAVAPLFGPIEVPWPPPAKPTAAILYLGVFGSVIAFACLLYLYKRMSLMATATLVFVQPMIAVTTDALFEREVVLSSTAYAGMGVTVLGIGLGAVTRALLARRVSNAPKSS